jgi:transketolase C-terminal domain/subunit
MVEETQANAGIGEALANAIGLRMNVPVSTINLGEQYVTHGNIKQLYAHYGLDGRSVANHVQEVLSNEN